MPNSYTQFIETVVGVAWHDDIATLLIMVAMIAGLFLRFRSNDRKTLMATLLLLGAALIGQLASVFIELAGFIRVAASLHEAFLILEGLAVIRLIGVFVFRVVLPQLGFKPPRILEDILVFVAYVGWGFARMHEAGVDLSGIVATSAVITAVLAFSMQDTLGNILGGLALQLDNSVEIGDWIKVDDVSGKVVEVHWRFTAIETRNWETVIVPNSQLMKSKFSVLGRHGDDPVQWRRWVWFNIGFDTSPSRVIQTANNAIRSAVIPNMAKTPEPNCVLMDFSDSYGRYAIRYWLTDLQADDPTDSEVRDHLYAALQRANIRLAFPEHSVHVIKENEKHEQARHLKHIHSRIDTLRKVELFSASEEDELLAIAEKLKFAPFAKGDVITHQGDVAHWLYIITEGNADVYLEVPGQDRRKLSTLHQGDFFGEMGLMTGAPRTATVIAASDIECYRLDKESFQEFVHKRPALADEITKVLVSRRYGLDSMQQDMDETTRASQMAQQHQDVLGRIRNFFGLKAAS